MIQIPVFLLPVLFSVSAFNANSKLTKYKNTTHTQRHTCTHIFAHQPTTMKVVFSVSSNTEVKTVCAGKERSHTHTFYLSAGPKMSLNKSFGHTQTHTLNPE